MKIYEGYGAQLDTDSELTSHDYTFLKGDEKSWLVKCSAYNYVGEWCRNNGYGDFGEPTERGIKAMQMYEQAQLMVHP